jgi:hypothetical protein
MAGLVPKRKTRDEIERANEEFLRRHRAYLEAWVSKKAQLAAGAENREPDSEVEVASATTGVVCC